MRILMGGSPCTYWSIAQTKNRETKPEGLGWELFKNYLISLEKFKPDYFLYENNYSMNSSIRKQITKELGVEPILINSALVSAQNRKRLYWTNIPGVGQPEDRGILLRDILDSRLPAKEKTYALKSVVGVGYRNRREADGRLYRRFETSGIPKYNAVTTQPSDYMMAESVRLGTIEISAKNADFDSQQYRVYSPDGKSVTLCGQGGGVGAKTGLYAVPVTEEELMDNIVSVDGYKFIPGETTGASAVQFLGGFAGEDGKRWLEDGKAFSRNFSQGKRLHGVDEKSVTVTAQGAGITGHAGLYAVPAGIPEESLPAGSPVCMKVGYPIYEVRNGTIRIKDRQYPIKLADGFYIIRKLTVSECKRLQTVPEDYTFPVSGTQAYKMLGNGWTVDVIAHILSHIPDIKTEPLTVLSMYDGMSCGHIALDKLGAHIAKYYATEIDKYAIKTSQANFPDIIHLGDAFQVREDNWQLPI